MINRPPRILWASAYCLLDTSSGAAISVREILHQLKKAGCDVEIVTATIFDNEAGKAGLGSTADQLFLDDRPFAIVADGALTHKVLKTRGHARSAMTSAEQQQWSRLYLNSVKTFKPDILFFFGGHMMDQWVTYQAQVRGIPVVAYLANGNYYGVDWCRNVDLILTDSMATSALYKERLGLPVTPIGAFIDPRRVVQTDRQPRHVTFINPVPSKGGLLVARLAMLLEKRRPDIMFEVVASRGRWIDAANAVTRKFEGTERPLTNVLETPNTSDMRPIYARSRILLAPSLGYESAGRVLAEAMLNGIPAIITNNGGMPELVGDAAVKLTLPEICHKPPYATLPPDAVLMKVADRIEDFFDNPSLYAAFSKRALRVAQERHDIGKNTQKLLDALVPLLDQKSGDLDHEKILSENHRILGKERSQ